MRIDGIKILSTAALFCSASTLPLHTLAANYPDQGGYFKHQNYPAYYGYKPVSNYNRAWSYPYYGYAAYQKFQNAKNREQYQRKINRGYPAMAYHRQGQANVYNYMKPRQQAQKQPAKPLKTARNTQVAAQYPKRINNYWVGQKGYRNPYSMNRSFKQDHRKTVNVQRTYPRHSLQRPNTHQSKPPVMNQWIQTKPQAYQWNYAKYYGQPYYWPYQQVHYSNQYKTKKVNLKTQVPQKYRKPIFKQVSITEQGFMPAQVKVNAGDQVVWANIDGVPHQVNSQNGWKSKILTRGATYTHTFSKPGIHKYYSASNPRWSGQVLVK